MEIPLRYTRWPAVLNAQGNEMKMRPACFQLKAGNLIHYNRPQFTGNMKVSFSRAK